MREEHDTFHAASVDEETEQAESHQSEYQQSIGHFPDHSASDRAHMIHMLRAITQKEAHNTMNELDTAWQRIVTSSQYETHIQHEHTDDTIKQAIPIWEASSAVMQCGKASSRRETIPPMKHRSRRVLSILAAVACIALVIGSMLWIENRIQTSRVAGNQHTGKATSTSLLPQLAYTYTQTGESYISSIRWSPTGDRLLSVGNTIKIWDFTKTILSLKNPTPSFFTHTVWSPDGTSIAINNGTTGIEIRNATTGQLQRICATPTPSGSQGQPGADIQTHQQSLLSARVPYTSRFADSTGGYFRLAWSPDGKYLAANFRAPGSGSTFGGLVVYATADCSIVWQPTTSAWYDLIEWSADSQYLSLSDDSSSNINIVNFAQKQVIYTYNSSDVATISWSPDGKRIAMYHSNGYVTVSDALTGAHSFTYKETTNTDNGNLLAWSPDSQYIVSIANTRSSTRQPSSVTRIWNATTGQVVHTFTSNNLTLAVAWSPDGNYIAIGYSTEITQKDATVAVWHIPHW